MDSSAVDLLRHHANFETTFTDLIVGEDNIKTPDVALEEEEELEFRLFAPSTEKVASETQDKPQRTVRIRSETPPSGEPGFSVPNRPDVYYFASEPSDKDWRDLQLASVTGEEVMTRSRSHWPGS